MVVSVVCLALALFRKIYETPIKKEMIETLKKRKSQLNTVIEELKSKPDPTSLAPSLYKWSPIYGAWVTLNDQIWYYPDPTAEIGRWIPFQN